MDADPWEAFWKAAAPLVDGKAEAGGVSSREQTTTTQIGEVTAGFELDVLVRLYTDRLTVNLDQFSAGELPEHSNLEIR